MFICKIIIVVEESFHQNLQYNIIYYNNCVCNYIQLKDQGLINIFLHNWLTRKSRQKQKPIENWPLRFYVLFEAYRIWLNFETYAPYHGHSTGTLDNRRTASVKYSPEIEKKFREAFEKGVFDVRNRGPDGVYFECWSSNITDFI